jgi:hypothetical protein
MSICNYTRRDFLRAAGASAAAMVLPARAKPPLNRANRDKRPNILFFFPDQHRFDWLGLNRQLPLRTPNLDKLAHRGVLFANALCSSPLCAPSRACLAAGKEYDRCGVAENLICANPKRVGAGMENSASTENPIFICGDFPTA